MHVRHAMSAALMDFEMEIEAINLNKSASDHGDPTHPSADKNNQKALKEILEELEEVMKEYADMYEKMEMLKEKINNLID